MFQYKSSSILMLPVLALISLLATNAYAADLSNGKTLHNANCRSCHKSIMDGEPDSIYIREHRRIDNYQALQNQVNRCESNTDIAWPQEQINDVVDYLNQQFYKFKK